MLIISVGIFCRGCCCWFWFRFTFDQAIHVPHSQTAWKNRSSHRAMRLRFDTQWPKRPHWIQQFVSETHFSFNNQLCQQQHRFHLLSKRNHPAIKYGNCCLELMAVRNGLPCPASSTLTCFTIENRNFTTFRIGIDPRSRSMHLFATFTLSPHSLTL